MRSTVTGRRHRRQPVSEELIHGARRAEGMTAAVHRKHVLERGVESCVAPMKRVNRGNALVSPAP